MRPGFPTDPEELARCLFEESNDALFLFDPSDLKLIDVNPRAQKLTATPRKQLLNLSLRELFESDAAAKLNELFESCQDTRLFHSREAYRLLCRDRTLDVNVTVSRLHAPPDTLGMVAVRDVSKRKALEQDLRVAKSLLQAALDEQSVDLELANAELREKERWIRELVNDVHAIVWEADPVTWQFTYVNNRAETMLGFKVEQWLNEPDFWINHLHEDDRDRCITFCKESTDSGLDHDFEYRMLAADGRYVWLHEFVRVVKNRESQVARLKGVMIDVTERRHAETQLRTIVSHLNVAEERERRRISGVLHDQLAPSIAACQMRLTALQNSLSNPDHRRIVDDIWEQLADCTEQARSLAVETSPPILYELGLESAIEWLADRFQQEHGIDCRVTTNTALLNVVDTALATLFQATRELLINVVRHARADKVDISIERQDGCVVIGVRDNGIGFNPDDKSFNTLQSQGFGLFGLRDRFHLFNGRVEIDSSPGNGTQVQLIAPLNFIQSMSHSVSSVAAAERSK